MRLPRRKKVADLEHAQKVAHLEHALEVVVGQVVLMSALVEDAQELLQRSLPASLFYSRMVEVLEASGAGSVPLDDDTSVTVMLEPAVVEGIDVSDAVLDAGDDELFPYGRPEDDNPFWPHG